jgi:hypothetical protein
MIDFNTCKNILEVNGIKHSYEEIKKVRLFLYQLAQIEIELLIKKQNEKCNYIYKGLN